MPHSQFIKWKIFHKSKVTNRLCNVITLVTALTLIDSYMHELGVGWEQTLQRKARVGKSKSTDTGWCPHIRDARSEVYSYIHFPVPGTEEMGELLDEQ